MNDPQPDRLSATAQATPPQTPAFHVSKKSEKITALLKVSPDGRHSPHYLGYFHCFNQSLYYEAHDVLEDQWLREREGSRGAFYKGLIQLAGAFVHLQKNRLKPADALFKLAESNMRLYPSRFEDLDLSEVLSLIEDWRQALAVSHFTENPISKRPSPVLQIEAHSAFHNL